MADPTVGAEGAHEKTDTETRGRGDAGKQPQTSPVSPAGDAGCLPHETSQGDSVGPCGGQGARKAIDADPLSWLPEQGEAEEILNLAVAAGYTHYLTTDGDWYPLRPFNEPMPGSCDPLLSSLLIAPQVAKWSGVVLEDGSLVLKAFNTHKQQWHPMLDLRKGMPGKPDPSTATRTGMTVNIPGIGSVPIRRSWLPHEGTLLDVLAAAEAHGFSHQRTPQDGDWVSIEALRQQAHAALNGPAAIDPHSIFAGDVWDWNGAMVDDGELRLLACDRQSTEFEPYLHLATADKVQRALDAAAARARRPWPGTPVDWLPGRATPAEVLDAAEQAGFTYYQASDGSWLRLAFWKDRPDQPEVDPNRVSQAWSLIWATNEPVAWDANIVDHGVVELSAMTFLHKEFVRFLRIATAAQCGQPVWVAPFMPRHATPAGLLTTVKRAGYSHAWIGGVSPSDTYPLGNAWYPLAEFCDLVGALLANPHQADTYTWRAALVRPGLLRVTREDDSRCCYLASAEHAQAGISPQQAAYSS